jgi:hypothetical protein
MSERGGLVPVRLSVALAAMAGMALTPPFALAYEEAYGAGGSPGLWPAGVAPWLFERGLLGGDAEVVYDRYGIAYLVALGLLTASLGVLARPVRGGRRVILFGLIVLCVGIFGDYAVPNDFVGGVGFLLQGVGFLVAWMGVGLLVRQHAGTLAGVGAALGMLASMFAGGALTGHIPSGPGLTILVGALAFALFAGVERDSADVVDTR